ncbi:MAG: Uma2 family endonuclease [Dinghuibacter sp.]|nr:Uma2 family endonuclease [Dinghuibacter sp.]
MVLFSNFEVMSSLEKYRPHYTYTDYLNWDGRWELIEGFPYAMSPSPSIRHQMIVPAFHQSFKNAIKKTGCTKCKVLDYTDWKIAEDTVLQPDVLVVCQPFTNRNYLDFPPEIIVEVLSPSTAQKDRLEKFEIYRQQGVKYYIIVDPVFNKIEIFQHSNGVYEAVSVTPHNYTFDIGGCTINADFSEVFDE